MMGRHDEAKAVPPDWIWTTPGGWTPGSELRTPDGEIVGRLIVRLRRWWQPPIYEIDAPGSRWRFHVEGTGRRRIAITTLALDEAAAVFHFNAREDGGQLVCADGPSFEWRRADRWGNTWLWLDGAGTPLLRFTVGGGRRLRAEVSFLTEQARAKSPGLLVFLGWFLLNDRHGRETMAAAVVTSG